MLRAPLESRKEIGRRNDGARSSNEVSSMPGKRNLSVQVSIDWKILYVEVCIFLANFPTAALCICTWDVQHIWILASTHVRNVWIKAVECNHWSFSILWTYNNNSSSPYCSWGIFSWAVGASATSGEPHSKWKKKVVFIIKVRCDIFRVLKKHDSWTACTGQNGCMLFWNCKTTYVWTFCFQSWFEVVTPWLPYRKWLSIWQSLDCLRIPCVYSVPFDTVLRPIGKKTDERRSEKEQQNV